MILRIPRDYENYVLYRNLTKELENDHALTSFVFHRLWTELGFQIEMHGKPGLFLRSETDPFTNTIKHPKGAGAMVALIQSDLLQLEEDDNYWCAMFAAAHPDLHKDHIDQSQRSRTNFLWVKKVRRHTDKAKDYVEKMPEELWLHDDGVTRLSQEEMNRCICLIKILDDLLDQQRRDWANYTKGMIQSAYGLIRTNSDDKLQVILQRLYSCKNSIRNLPRNTIEALRDWDEMLIKIMPNEGYIQWASSPKYYQKDL